ncbi:MAG: hypothetical protein KBA03_00405 [Anaerolineaceae bacterium]|nr:hypothetical protein [Anaerolineaceae bacterium]
MTVTLNLSLILETLYQIVNAGVAITAIALLMYSTGFNFKDRIVRIFLLVLFCLALIYSSETVVIVSDRPEFVQFWLQMKWVGLMMLPAVFFHFSDQLLTVTGRPSRGRRKTFVVVAYVISIVSAILIFFGVTIGGLAPTKAPMAFLERNQTTFYFGLFYILVMMLVSYNLIRTLIRTSTKTGMRRMIYLMVGVAAIAINSVTFLYHGNSWFAQHPHWFWLVSIIGSVINGLFIIVMTYTVSFFGLRWTDRQIKSRLWRWLLRGPLTAAVVLALVTITRRYGERLGNPYIFLVPMVIVGSILLIQYAINIVSPYVEKKFFWGSDKEDLERIQNLQDRMLTNRDLQQLLETIGALISDRLPVSAGFIAVLEGDNVSQVVTTGEQKAIDELKIDETFIKQVNEIEPEEALFEWEGLYLLPLQIELEDGKEHYLGLGGFIKNEDRELEEEDRKAVLELAERASLAIKDHAIQKQVIESLSSLQTEVDALQNFRAISSFKIEPLESIEQSDLPEGMESWVKDALTHYWGGPKLTSNPLLQLKVVEVESEHMEGNLTNALRAVLTEAIEMTKPSGDRKYTSEWLLYNILDLKYLQGKKVREVARKLAVSEADLYRKQKIAIETVAQKIADLEADAHAFNQDKEAETNAEEQSKEHPEE